MTEGSIYILFNRAFQNDQYKIGKTTTTPEARAGNIRGNGPASGSQSSAFGAGANAKKGVPSATGQVSARPQTRVAGFKNYDWFPQMEPGKRSHTGGLRDGNPRRLLRHTLGLASIATCAGWLLG
jgi:hypothetical protein